MSAASNEKPPRFDDTVRVLRAGLRSMYKSRLPQMAAALSYRTIFALIPMLVISVAAIGAFAEPDDVRDMLNKTLSGIGLSDIEINDPVQEKADETLGPDAEVKAEDVSDLSVSVGGEPVDADEVAEKVEETKKEIEQKEEVAEQIKEAAKQPEDELAVGPEPPIVPLDESDAESDAAGSDAASGKISSDEVIAGLIDRILGISFATIGAVGLLTLIYASVSMLVEIERAFNVVYRAKAGKSWGRRLTQYWAVITLVPIFLFAAFYASEQFRELGEGALSRAGGGVLAFVGSVISIAITTLLLLLAYVIIPNVRVRVSSGIVGALVGAILWEVAKWGFRQYLDYSVGYAKIYGIIGLLPLALLWIYLTWLIILFGLQVAYGLQHIENARQIDEEDVDNRLTDPAAVFGVLAVIAGRFERGKTTDVSRLSDELSLSAEVIGSITEKLSRSEIIRDVDDEERRYTLARPASGIPLDEAMNAMSEITDAGIAAESNWTRAVERLDRARQDVVKGLSVADLISERDRNKSTGPASHAEWSNGQPEASSKTEKKFTKDPA